MSSTRRRRVSALLLLLVLVGLLGGASGAVAQGRQPADDEVAADDGTADDEGQAGEAEDAGADAGDDDSAPEESRCPDGEVDTRPGADEPRCRPAPRCPDGEVDATPEALEPTCGPPRCPDGEIDTTPTADEPTCMEPARLDGLIAEFEAAAAEEVEALAELSDQLQVLTELHGQLDDLLVRLAEVQMRFAGAAADARFAEIRHEIAGEGLDDANAELAAEEERLRTQAVQAYMGGDAVELGVDTALAELDAGNELETAKEYASVVLDDQLATVDRVDALREAVASLEEVVAQVEEAASADAERVAGIESQARTLLERQRDLVDAAEAEAAALAQQIAEIQERKASFAEELRISGVGGGSIGDLLRTAQAGQVPPTISEGLLAMPLETTRLASPFGPRVHPIFGDPRMHTGIDLSGASGQPILSSADGIVIFAGEAGGYGNVVVVDHGNTLSTLYAHMTADAVTVGQEVAQGDLLGFVGSTGFSTGPHLHLEVRLMGQPVDPLPYLDFSGS